MAVTTYMNLTLPTVSVTPGPLYATENNDAFTTIDSHDHTTGKGVPIPSSGILIGSDLDFNGYSAIGLKSLFMDSQSSAVATINTYYALNGLPYFNNSAGTNLQLTATSAPFVIGDLIYASSTTTWTRLAAIAGGNFLKTNGVGTAPSWGNPAVTTPIASKTHANNGYTLTSTDGVILWTLTNSSDDIYIVPLAASAGAGQTYTIKLLGSTANFNTLSGTRSGGDTFTLMDGTTGATTIQHQTGGEEYQIISDGVTTWQVIKHQCGTNYTAYTPSYGAGFGTVANSKVYWRRNIDSIDIFGSAQAGTVSSAAMSATLPTNILINQNKLSVATAKQLSGYLTFLENGPGPTATVFANVFFDGSTTGTIFFGNTTGSNIFIKTNATSYLNSSQFFTFSFSVPIAGWVA